MSTVNAFEQHEGNAAVRGVRWPLHAAFIVTLFAFCVFYSETILSLIHTWASTGRYEYAFLIPPVSATLVWLRRDQLKQLPAKPAASGLVALTMLCLIWLAGAAAHINLATQFSIIAVIPCLVFIFYGTAITRALVFPLAYLFFAVPFGNFLVGPLQTITARLSVAALQWTPVPVFLDGHYIMTPASTWHVAEACSGVSFFFATTAFGVLYANLFFRRWHRRLIFVILALITPVIANGLRVFFTILIGETFGIQYATGTDHMIFGWQFFGTVLVLLFLVGWPWHETQPDNRTFSQLATARASGAKPKAALGLLVASLVLLGVAPLWINATAGYTVTDRSAKVIALPEALGDLSQTGNVAAESGPGTVFRDADRYARVRYGRGHTKVLVNVAVYAGTPGEESELVNFGNRVFNPAAWTVAGNAGDASSSAPSELKALHLVPRGSNDRDWLVWYAYRLGDHVTRSKTMVKIWQAWARLLGQDTTASAVVLASPIANDNTVAAEKRLTRVSKDLLSWLQQHPSGRHW